MFDSAPPPSGARVATPEGEDLLSSLAQLIDDGSLAVAIEHRNFGAALGGAAATISAHTDAIRRLELLAGAASQCVGALTPTERTTVSEAAATLREIGENIAAASDGPTLTQAVGALNLLTREVKTLEASLRTAWERGLSNEFDSDRRLGEVLTRVRECAALGKALATDAQRGLSLSASFPANSTHCAQRTALREACDVHRAKLAATGAAEVVVQFLLAAAKGSATLADVSPEVRAWLDTQDALVAFRIVLQ